MNELDILIAEQKKDTDIITPEIITPETHDPDPYYKLTGAVVKQAINDYLNGPKKDPSDNTHYIKAKEFLFDRKNLEKYFFAMGANIKASYIRRKVLEMEAEGTKPKISRKHAKSL